MDKLSVIVPVYNEGGNISAFLDELVSTLKGSGRAYEVIVVDDGSTDNSAEEIKKHGVVVFSHPYNLGYGAAIKTGMRKSTGDWICIIDADGTYSAADIPTLMRYAGEYDMVVGARTGAQVRAQILRRFAKAVLRCLAGYLTQHSIPDLNSGLRIFRKKPALMYLHLLSDRFSFTTTLTLAFLSNSLTVRYVPINYGLRVGKSKIKPGSDTINFIILIVKTVTYFNPLRIFLPLSIILLALGFLVFTYSVLVVGRVMDISVIVLWVSSLQLAALGLLADLIKNAMPRTRYMDD